VGAWPSRAVQNTARLFSSFGDQSDRLTPVYSDQANPQLVDEQEAEAILVYCEDHLA